MCLKWWWSTGHYNDHSVCRLCRNSHHSHIAILFWNVNFTTHQSIPDQVNRYSIPGVEVAWIISGMEDDIPSGISYLRYMCFQFTDGAKLYSLEYWFTYALEVPQHVRRIKIILRYHLETISSGMLPSGFPCRIFIFKPRQLWRGHEVTRCATGPASSFPVLPCSFSEHLLSWRQCCQSAQPVAVRPTHAQWEGNNGRWNHSKIAQ